MTDRIGNMTKTGHAPSDAEKQEIVAATRRHEKPAAPPSLPHHERRAGK
jgi:hypothetical protein